MSGSKISRIEHGKCKHITYEDILLIAAELHADAEYLSFGWYRDDRQ